MNQNQNSCCITPTKARNPLKCPDMDRKEKPLLTPIRGRIQLSTLNPPGAPLKPSNRMMDDVSNAPSTPRKSTPPLVCPFAPKKSSLL